jgi:hypothetical protein
MQNAKCHDGFVEFESSLASDFVFSFHPVVTSETDAGLAPERNPMMLMIQS